MSTILLVDDDESIRLTLSALLENDGFVVRAVTSCAEARTALRSLVNPDIVLLDQHLGDGSGAGLLGAIRDSLPRARIVLMSGSVDMRSLPSTADAYFEKGGAFSDLLAMLHGLLVGDR